MACTQFKPSEMDVNISKRANGILENLGSSHRLREKQVECLEKIIKGKDVLGIRFRINIDEFPCACAVHA